MYTITAPQYSHTSKNHGNGRYAVWSHPDVIGSGHTDSIGHSSVQEVQRAACFIWPQLNFSPSAILAACCVADVIACEAVTVVVLLLDRGPGDKDGRLVF